MLQEWTAFKFPVDDPDAKEVVGRTFPAPVEGYCCEAPDYIGVGWIACPNPRAFLSVLRRIEAEGKRVVFYTVVSAKLARILELRGYAYSEQAEYSRLYGEWVTGWVKPANP